MSYFYILVREGSGSANKFIIEMVVFAVVNADSKNIKLSFNKS